MGEVAADALARQERGDGSVDGAARAGDVGHPLAHPAAHRVEEVLALEGSEVGTSQREQPVALAVAAGAGVADEVDLVDWWGLGGAGDGGSVVDLETTRTQAARGVEPRAVVLDHLANR